MLQPLYHKFTDHYPEFLFGYRVTDLFIKISVLDKRSTKAKKTIINLDSTQDEVKMAWYTLLKELDPLCQSKQPTVTEVSVTS